MILVSLLVVDVSDLVSGLSSGLVFQFGSELPFATFVDQIELRGCLWSRFPKVLVLEPGSGLRHLSIRSSFEDVSGLVFGLVLEPGSELPFPIPVDQTELNGCLWSRFWSRF